MKKLNKRTIMIFPEFENIRLIDDIRQKYDPLASLVRPHITIVFPFELEMSNEELSQILDTRLEKIKPFAIELQGFSKGVSQFGNYLLLNLTKGQDIIRHMHDILYNNEFKACDLGLEYIPHITVGKLASVEELNDAYEHMNNNCKFFSAINKISVEMIGDKEESIIVIEKKLL